MRPEYQAYLARHPLVHQLQEHAMLPESDRLWQTPRGAITLDNAIYLESVEQERKAVKANACWAFDGHSAREDRFIGAHGCGTLGD